MKPKICFVNPTIILKRPVAQLLNRLKKDYEVALLIPHVEGKKLDDSMHYSKLDRVNIFTYPTKGLPGVAQEWPMPSNNEFRKNLDYIFAHYDIIHVWTHFYLTNFQIFVKKFFKKKKSPKLILTMDTLPGYSFSAGKKFDVAFKLYTNTLGWLIFGAPDLITLYGKSLLGPARKSHINMKKVKVLSTGIDLKPKGKNIRKKLGVKDDEVMLLFIGLMLYERKGIDSILNTIKKIEKEKIKVFLVGGGPELDKAKKEVKRLRLEKKVFLTGFRKDVADFYESADTFFFPSRGEGLAGVIMEAMTHSLPIVSTKIPCTVDLVEEEKTGFLCSINDVDCFSEKLLLLIKNKQLREKMGSAAKEKIKDFDWEKVIKEYEKMYKKLFSAY
jgi:glycosyltransferase involved in cell wall biosynthesis